MRENPYLRYFIGFLVTIGLIILLIVLLFTGGGNKNNNNQPSTSSRPKTVDELAAYASTDAVVRLTIDGPIVADQNHQAVQVTVGQDDVTYSQVQGYQGTVANQQSFVNNQNAYSNLLYALGHAGFLKGDSSKALANEKGYCPTGNRYVFELIEDGQDVQRYWATSCGGTPKTYKGNLNLTLTLFQAQVPNYNQLTQNLNLNTGSLF
ncbi:MAG TPA: hypothetical protein VHC21_00515 [Candidatus Saccharimonadales bacterium]|nr:hypothetical protein [Candidatus Saccharimonadales bacterium]